MEVSEPKVPRWATGRAVLDILTSVVLLAAAGFLVWRATSVEPPPPPAYPLQDLGSAPLKGDASAAVALIVYSDFQCPFCKRFAVDVLPSLTAKYVDSGKVQLAFRHMPLEAIHPLAIRAAEATVCAQRQGMFWAAHDRVFEIKERLSERGIADAMTAAGIDLSEWERCMQTGPSLVVKGDLVGGRQLGISSTPFFLIGTVKGKSVDVVEVINGAQTAATFAAALDRVISRANQ